MPALPTSDSPDPVVRTHLVPVFPLLEGAPVKMQAVEDLVPYATTEQADTESDAAALTPASAGRWLRDETTWSAGVIDGAVTGRAAEVGLYDGDGDLIQTAGAFSRVVGGTYRASQKAATGGEDASDANTTLDAVDRGPLWERILAGEIGLITIRYAAAQKATLVVRGGARSGSAGSYVYKLTVVAVRDTTGAMPAGTGHSNVQESGSLLRKRVLAADFADPDNLPATPADIGKLRVLSNMAHVGDNTFNTSAYTGTATPTLGAELDGIAVLWRVPAANLGPSTLSVDGLTARNLAHFPDGRVMNAGDLPRNGMAVSVLNGHTWYTLGLRVRWDELIGAPEEMPEAEAKAGTATTERTISAARLKTAIKALADTPQDELEALIAVLAQGREMVRTWSNTGLSSTEGEAVISTGNNASNATFNATEWLALDGDDDTEIDYILSATAGAVVLCRDNTGSRFLVFRSRGAKALVGEDTYGIFYNTSDILYETGIDAYGTGWDTTAAGGTIYIVPRHVLEGELGAYVKTDGTNITDKLRAAVQRRNEAVILSKTYARKAQVGTGLSAAQYYIAFDSNDNPTDIFFYADQTDVDLAAITEGWQSGDIIQFQTTNNAVTDWRAGYALEITSGFSQNGSLWHAFVKRYGAAGVLPPADAARYVRFAGEDAHRFEFGLPVFLAAAVNLFGAGGAAGKLWAYVSSATNATWRRLLDVLVADAGTAAKRADYRAALATGRLQKSVAGNSNVALTAAEGAYDSIELTGAKTGAVIVTLPAAPSGVRLVRNQSTGNFALKVKAANQADAAAVTLASGDNVVLHHGGSLALLGQKRRWVNSNIGTTGEAIAQNLHDDDVVTIWFEYTDKDTALTGARAVTNRFGDLDADDRVVMYVQGNNEAAILSKSGTTLNCKSGTGLSALSTVVLAERHTFETLTLS